MGEVNRDVWNCILVGVYGVWGKDERFVCKKRGRRYMKGWCEGKRGGV